MNLPQLVLTLVLVGGGLFVYDAFIAERAEPVVPEAPPVVQPAIRPVESVEPPMRVELQGAGLDGIVARLDDLEARIGDLMGRDADGPVGGRDLPRGIRMDLPTALQPDGSAEGETPEFDPEVMAWFRAMKEEVDRQVRQERFEQMIGNQLDRTKVVLTEEQRDSVIQATIAYRGRIRTSYREKGFSEKAPEERKQALDLLKADYEQSLYTLVPAAEADQILEQMGRYPGFSGRQIGGSRPR